MRVERNENQKQIMEPKTNHGIVILKMKLQSLKV